MIKIKSTGLRALRNQLAAMPVDVPKEMRIAAWKAQKRGRSEVAKRLSKVIKQPAKRLKGASYAKMLPKDQGFIFVIRAAFKIAMKAFKPRHLKNGVQVNVLKTESRERRHLYTRAFLGGKPGKPSPKLNGNPMQRTGDERYPIKRVPAAVVVTEIRGVIGLTGGLMHILQDEYRKQVQERIRFLKLKLAGKLRNQKNAT